MRHLCLLLVATCLFACRKSSTTPAQAPQPLDPALGQYIVSHSPQNIGIQTKEIHIALHSTLRQKGQIGEALAPQLYSIQPKVAATAHWQNPFTIAVRFQEDLDYNTTYQVQLHLDQLFDDVDAEQATATLGFHTMPLTFDIQLNGIDYKTDAEAMSCTGYITSSDYIEPKKVEDLLKYKYPDAQLSWSHRGNYHHFTIQPIKPRDKASNLKISWNGGRLDPNFNGQKNIEIAARGQFVSNGAMASTGNERHVMLYFSKPLAEQDLEGLVEIEGYSGKLRFDIIGNQVKVTPQSKVNSPCKVLVHEGILASDRSRLDIDESFPIAFEPVKPRLKLLGKGVIVPNSGRVIFPFEAINLKSAIVTVSKVFDNNVLQFLQYNTLTTQYVDHTVGRKVYTDTIDLASLNPEKNYDAYVRYALDLQDMVQLDPDAIYNVSISFRKSDVGSYPCEGSSNNGGYGQDPCKSSYYRSGRNRIQRNVLASNLGISVQREVDQDLHVSICDLRSLAPISGAVITAYDFQQQQISAGTSDAKGMARIEGVSRKPAFVIVEHADGYGYVNIQDQHALNTSEFDVSGTQHKAGINGRFYAERGVWRPGDSLFLNFVLEDRGGKLPANHPVVFTLKDARGKQKLKKVLRQHVGGIYHLPIATQTNDPTGTWKVSAKVGGRTFGQRLKIENIKPNRLKINLEIAQALRLKQNSKIDLGSEWLHGASADGLRAKVDLSLTGKKVHFDKYKKYNFEDPARQTKAQPTTVFDGKLDAAGQAQFSIPAQKDWQTASMLRARFHTKVFEKSGNFSEDNYSIDAHLYDAYVGIDIPKTRWGSQFIKSNTETPIPLVVVNADGQPLSNRKLKVGIYEARWNWWYDRGYSSRYNYNSSNHTGAVSTKEVTTDGSGKAEYLAKFTGYGNYMIRVCDEESGHCTGGMFYTGRYWSYRGEQEGPQQLNFTTDKAEYKLGEEVDVRIPSNADARILISVDNGDRVLDAFWVDAQADQTKISIPTDSYASESTLYISASLIQPHNNGENDLALRMYGVVPVRLVDPATQLEPVLQLPATIRPQETYTVNVSEKDGEGMVYTLAIVDEGLLSLTRFKTPDLWKYFYAKKAKQTKAWDIYDMVLNNYGGEVDRYISIGGDGEALQAANPKKANRFKPVVQHLGPFVLKPGEVAQHQITLPNYVGAVRTMVVARQGIAYGKADASTPVKKPLMVQTTLPRVLGPNETLSLPVNVFAMEDHVRQVNVSAEVSEGLSLAQKSQSLTFDKVGDQISSFDLSVGGKTGVAKVTTQASSGRESAAQNIEIQVRNPNPITAKVEDGVLAAGETWTAEISPFGTEGTRKAFLEVSQLPSIDFGRRLRYLIRYPHGCIEQTTSGAFPQLYIKNVSDLNPKQLTKIQKNINAAINRLQLFKLPNGSLSYWPGRNSSSKYGSTYAAHFLVEAKEAGYNVPNSLLEPLLKYLSTTNNEGMPTARWNEITRAYSLYVLARANKANIGAMNRLRTAKKLDATAAHLLATAYAIIGQDDVARAILAKASITVEPYRETGYSYGSHIRDMAMMAECYTEMDRNADAAKMVKALATEMNKQRWFSTQTNAYALLAVGKFARSFDGKNLAYQYTAGQVNGEASTDKAISEIELDIDQLGDGKVSITNTSGMTLFTRYVMQGQLEPGQEEPARSRHLELKISYQDRSGQPIDPAEIKQGTDFQVVSKVTNLGTKGYNVDEVALTQIFPSGWEIQNERLAGASDRGHYEYVDIGDDRVNYFFDLHGKKTKTFKTLLTATYAGRFYLPPVYVEAMYDSEIQATSTGQWIKVVR